MPDSYIRSKRIHLLELLKNFASKGTINHAGGAVYLPFKYFYYFAVAGHEEELEVYYKIAYINEDIVSKENHLYQGTVGLGDDVLDLLNVAHIAEGCVAEKEIAEFGQIHGVPPAVVQAHYKKLNETLDNLKDVCMIRLQILKKAIIEKNLTRRIKTERA